MRLNNALIEPMVSITPVTTLPPWLATAPPRIALVVLNQQKREALVVMCSVPPVTMFWSQPWRH